MKFVPAGHNEPRGLAEARRALRLRKGPPGVHVKPMPVPLPGPKPTRIAGQLDFDGNEEPPAA